MTDKIREALYAGLRSAEMLSAVSARQTMAHVRSADKDAETIRAALAELDQQDGKGEPAETEILEIAGEHGTFSPSAWDTGIPQFHTGQPGLLAFARAVFALKPTFQRRVQPWLMECFGAEIAGDKQERNHRFLEEALELVQSCGATASEAHQLVDYVYGRPVGEQQQEVGGVMVTLAALCLAQGLDMHEAGEIELARIWTKVEKIRAKQAAKPKHSPLPEAKPLTRSTSASRADLDAAKVEAERIKQPWNDHRLKIGQHYIGCVTKENADRIMELQARAERDALDGKRYRWLRTSGYTEIYLHNQPGIDNCKEIAGDGLDAAIDAALLPPASEGEKT